MRAIAVIATRSQEGPSSYFGRLGLPSVTTVRRASPTTSQLVTAIELHPGAGRRLRQADSGGSSCRRFPSGQSRFGFERFAHFHEASCDAITILRRFGRAASQFCDLAHLFMERPSAARPSRQIGEGLESAEHARHDGYIAFGATPDLLECLGQQRSKRRRQHNHAESIALVTARCRKLAAA